MTLIMGLNFSHKLYLAGDTRVTKREPEKDPLYIDNVLKVVPLWGRGIQPQSFYNDDTISVAVAGDIFLATYLFREIKKALNLNVLSSDIRTFSEQVEPFVKERIDEWLKKHKHSLCCLLFAGMTKSRKKKISREKLDELIALFNQRKELDRPGRERFEKETFPNDPTFQLIDKRMREDSGRGVMEALREGDRPVMSDWIKQALAAGADEIEMPDSLIVGIKVDTQIGIKKEIAEWGEFLAYGAGLTKGDLPGDLVAVFELSHIKKEKENPALMEGAILTQVILDTARERNIGTIGGTVVLVSTLSDGRFYIQGKDVRSTPTGEYCLEFYGQKIPLMPFNRYPDGRAGENAEM